MKTFKLTTLIVLMFVFHSSNAQNWHFVETEKTYHYSCDTTNLIFSIWADSVKINGKDTIWFANRVILPCDTCHAENYPNSYANKFMLKNQALFLQREIKVSENGKINLQSPDSFIIEKNFAINQTWNFSNSKNAEIYFRGIGNVLGVQDSIIGIIVNSTDTIVISKNYGVVQYPCVAGKYFRLIGVESKNSIGYHVPTFYEIYKFEKDDIIHKRAYEGDPGGYYDFYGGYQILNVETDSIEKFQYVFNGCQTTVIDGINFIHDTIHQENNGENFFINQTERRDCYHSIESVRTFQDTSFESLNCYPEKRYNIVTIYQKNGITYFEQKQTIFKKLNDIFLYSNANPDIIVNDTNHNEINEILIIERTGLIHNYYSAFEYDFRFENKKVDIYTTPSDDMFCNYFTLTTNNIQEKSIQLFPNPTTGIINISGLNVENIEVYNVFGQKVYRKSFSNSESNENLKIDLKNYVSKGIYFVNIQSENKNYSSKLIVN